jgi:hypothetical protein
MTTQPQQMCSIDSDCDGDHFLVNCSHGHIVHGKEYKIYQYCVCPQDLRSCCCDAGYDYRQITWCDCINKDDLKKILPNAFNVEEQRQNQEQQNREQQNPETTHPEPHPDILFRRQ